MFRITFTEEKLVKKIGTSLVLAVALLVIGFNANAVTGYTEVNNELFDKAHLKNISQEGTLHYSYTRDSFIDGIAADTVDLEVTNIRNTGRADTHIEFFTGSNKRPYEDRDNQQGNSAFVFFLEWDVHEMQRLTEGDWRYFQRRIRWALAQGVPVKQVEVDYQGKKVAASQYIIQPYKGDPKNSRYSVHANKYYIFTLSEEIPGEIYQVRTIVPDGDSWQEGDAVLIDESLNFINFEATK